MFLSTALASRNCVDIYGESLMLRIQLDGQREGEYQFLPVGPECEEFLQAVPMKTGWGVFNPVYRESVTARPPNKAG